MSGRPQDLDYDGERPTGNLAPELDNGQQAEPDQAQDVTNDALDLESSSAGFEDSEKVPGGIEDFDTPDLVDHMNQMVTSGRVDMSAFRGEPDHDGEGDDIRMEVNGGPGGDPDNPEDEDDGVL
jgi:hypothetical protein